MAAKLPKLSLGEETLAFHLRAHKLPPPAREYPFHPVRKWRFDFAWPLLMLACEVEGGVHSGGRHTRGGGFEEDCEKYGEAMRYGWTVYRCTPYMINHGVAIQTLKHLFSQRSNGLHINAQRGRFDGLYIKVIDGNPTPEDRNWIRYLHDAGFCARILPSWVHALALVQDYLSWR